MNRFRETVTIQVTMRVSIPQAIALREMFRYWDFCGNAGMSREVSFMVDGDGDFHPQPQFVVLGNRLPYLPDERLKKAVVRDKNGDLFFDYDPIAWQLDEHYKSTSVSSIQNEASEESSKPSP